jgi:hypothetical protein
MMTRRGYWCENAIAAFDKGGTVNGTIMPAHAAPVNIGAGDQYPLLPAIILQFLPGL